jgi:ATP-dependent DNA helicase RecG
MSSISKIDPSLTHEYIYSHVENQYLERKGLHDEHIKPSKIANEIIGMLNAGGGVLILGIADGGAITDLSSVEEDTLNKYRTLHFNFITSSECST